MTGGNDRVASLDTEQFYASLDTVQPDRKWPALGELLDGFTRRFDARIAGFGAPKGDLDRIAPTSLPMCGGARGKSPACLP